MRRLLLVVLAAVALALPSCQRQEPSAPPKREGKVILPSDETGKRDNTTINLRPDRPFFMDRSALGNTLNASGAVEADNTAIQTGAPVYLTLYLKESPPGLKTSAVWYRDDKSIHQEVKPAGGAKVITFALEDKKLPPGKYHVIGYWGGNVASDKEFEILPRAKK